MNDTAAFAAAQAAGEARAPGPVHRDVPVGGLSTPEEQGALLAVIREIQAEAGTSPAAA